MKNRAAPITPAKGSLRSGRAVRSRRRGVTIVLVLGLISMTLALSYAILRAQSTLVQIHSNGQRKTLARQAAVTGLTMALRKMSVADGSTEGAWSGVGTSFGQSLSSTERFEAQYLAPDSALVSRFPDEPYLLVRIVSTGFSTEPGPTPVSTTHQAEAVVKLVPRQRGNTPSFWSRLPFYTLYQMDNRDVKIRPRVKVQGGVWIEGTLELPSSGWGNGWISGPFRSAWGHSWTQQLTLIGLNIPYSQFHGSYEPSNWTHPGKPNSYQVYPGGPQYSIPRLSAEIGSSDVLQPNPLTNPLGIFCRTSNLTIKEGAQVRGTILVDGDLKIEGGGLSLEPVAMPPIGNSNAYCRLPGLVVNGDIQVEQFAAGTIRGLIATWKKFELKERTGGLLTFQGCVLFDDLELKGGEPSWSNIPTFEPLHPSGEPGPSEYAWLKSGTPVLGPATSDDGGLRWNLLHWQE